MDLQEYLNQTDPRKMPSFSVVVKFSDLKQFWSVQGGTVFIIKNLENYRYFSPNLSTRELYTLTEDGEKNKATVFRLSTHNK